MKFQKYLMLLFALILLAGRAPMALAEEALPDSKPAVEEAAEPAQAEEPPEAQAEAEPAEEEIAAEEVEAAPVDAIVEEITISLGEDSEDDAFAEVPEAEPAEEPDEAVDAAVENASYDPSEFIFDCPDVMDLKDALVPSDRVYPGALLWPLKGREPLSNLTSRVGWRNAARIHAAQGGTWPSWLHHGIDVGGVDTNQLVVAAASGLAYADVRDGSGKYVVIDHGNGWYTKYQHLSRFAGRIDRGTRGKAVSVGEAIGYVGSTGGDYPVHFHLEIAWSPDGPGSDDVDFQRETHNRSIRAYSFPQESVVTLHWADDWEICTAENQPFLSEAQFYHRPD